VARLGRPETRVSRSVALVGGSVALVGGPGSGCAGDLTTETRATHGRTAATVTIGTLTIGTLTIGVAAIGVLTAETSRPGARIPRAEPRRLAGRPETLRLR
jgi:hypothetical protein